MGIRDLLNEDGPPSEDDVEAQSPDEPDEEVAQEAEVAEDGQQQIDIGEQVVAEERVDTPTVDSPEETEFTVPDSDTEQVQAADVSVDSEQDTPSQELPSVEGDEYEQPESPEVESAEPATYDQPSAEPAEEMQSGTPSVDRVQEATYDQPSAETQESPEIQTTAEEMTVDEFKKEELMEIQRIESKRLDFEYRQQENLAAELTKEIKPMIDAYSMETRMTVHDTIDRILSEQRMLENLG